VPLVIAIPPISEISECFVDPTSLFFVSPPLLKLGDRLLEAVLFD
jgi:hypothetical protein